MKLLIVLVFAMTSFLAFAEQVDTDCIWADQDNRTAGKQVKESSPSSTKQKGSTVKSE